MDERAEGLHFDFTADNGSFLLVDRNPPLSGDDLNPIEMQMLLHNHIPSLLPVQFEEVDRRVRLLYDIGGKKLLSHRLKREQLSQEQYLRMMLLAVTALADCGGYMLSEECLLLRGDCIFTGTDIVDLYFPYVPIQSYAGQQSLLEQLKSFSAQCLGSVASMEGQSIPRVLASLRDETIRCSELKELLLTLLLERPLDTSDEKVGAFGPEFRQPEANDSLVPKGKPSWITSASFNARTIQSEAAPGPGPERLLPPSAPMPLAKRTLSAEGDMLPLESSGSGSWFKRIRELKDEVGSTLETGELPMKKSGGKKPQMKGKFDGNTLKKNVYLSAAALALIAFIWSFYSKTSSSVDIIVMVGLSGIIGLGILVILRAHPGWLYGNDIGKMDQIDPEIDEGAFGIESNIWSGIGTLPQARKDTPAWVMPVEQPLEQDSPLLNTSTVLLNPDMLQAKLDAQVNRYWLDITKETGFDKVKLVTDSFLIGREDGAVHYPLEGAGVSKHHLELINRGGIYSAQDLGSTNGTLLNGERMAPYKMYPLVDGDQLSIIRTQFVFKTE